MIILKWHCIIITSRLIPVEMSFIPLDSGIPSARTVETNTENTEVIPAKRVALTDILPLTMVGDQVMTLAMDPTNSALPLSPIFIRTSGDIGHGFPGLGQDAASLLDNLDEITSLPHEFLNIGRLCAAAVGEKWPCCWILNSSHSSVIHQLNSILSFSLFKGKL